MNHPKEEDDNPRTEIGLALIEIFNYQEDLFLLKGKIDATDLLASDYNHWSEVVFKVRE